MWERVLHVKCQNADGTREFCQKIIHAMDLNLGSFRKNRETLQPCFSHKSSDPSFSQFLTITVSAIWSFHYHVSLSLHHPFDFPYMFSVFFIIIFCLLPLLIYTKVLPSLFFYSMSDHIYVFLALLSSFTFHTRILGSNLLWHLFNLLIHISIYQLN